MKVRTRIFLLAALLATVLTGTFSYGHLALAGGGNETPYTDEFFLDDCSFSTKGSNRFFILEPDYQLTLSGVEKDGTKIVLAITVLGQTRDVDGVRTRIVEERETADGKLIEVSNNYFAICQQSNSVFYFGEKVDFYVGGVVVSHKGSWLAGENNAKAGLFMAGLVLLGSRYQQETAPEVAMDRAEIVSMSEVVNTPAGIFENVLKTKDTTPLEPRAVEYKLFAAGIGLIQDGILKLTEHGFV